MIREKGIYIVSEPACLIPGSGAYSHIEHGLNELKKSLEIDLVLFCEDIRQSSQESRGLNSVSNPLIQNRKLATIKKFVKWWYVLFINHIYFFKYYTIVKKLKPEFVYERSSYLNYNGLLISKLLKIPHFYEINGVTYKDNSVYFPGFCNWLAKKLERLSYINTTGFYVGGINLEMNINNERAIIIQNGIDKEFLENFENLKRMPSNEINIVFIGHALPHHRLDVLVDAIKLLKNPFEFSLHLIGTNLNSLVNQLPSNIEVKYYGKLSHEEIAGLMPLFDCGVITYSEDYFSHVKAFMYGAAKLIMLIPDSRNFKNIFSEKEVVYFENASPEDLSKKLMQIKDSHEFYIQFGERVYINIKDNFTWDKIYLSIANHIKNTIG